MWRLGDSTESPFRLDRPSVRDVSGNGHGDGILAFIVGDRKNQIQLYRVSSRVIRAFKWVD